MVTEGPSGEELSAYTSITQNTTLFVGGGVMKSQYQSKRQAHPGDWRARVPVV